MDGWDTQFTLWLPEVLSRLQIVLRRESCFSPVDESEAERRWTSK